MKEYKLNTWLLNNLICVDLNETVLGGELEYQQVIENAVEDGVSEYEIKFDKDENLRCVERALERLIKNDLMPFLSQYGVSSIELGEWYHPTEYNFYCDRIDLITWVNPDFYKIALQVLEEWRNDDDIHQYIADNFKTRSGFIALGPQTLNEIIVDMRITKTTHAVAEYLTLLLWKEFGDTKLQNEVEDNYLSYEVTNTQIAWYELTK